ncbi:hypothetical protein RKD22_000001 [Streptomyces pristinaespiralis]
MARPAPPSSVRAVRSHCTATITWPASPGTCRSTQSFASPPPNSARPAHTSTRLSRRSPLTPQQQTLRKRRPSWTSTSNWPPRRPHRTRPRRDGAGRRRTACRGVVRRSGRSRRRGDEAGGVRGHDGGRGGDNARADARRSCAPCAAVVGDLLERRPRRSARKGPPQQWHAPPRRAARRARPGVPCPRPRRRRQRRTRRCRQSRPRRQLGAPPERPYEAHVPPPPDRDPKRHRGSPGGPISPGRHKWNSNAIS